MNFREYMMAADEKIQEMDEENYGVAEIWGREKHYGNAAYVYERLNHILVCAEDEDGDRFNNIP